MRIILKYIKLILKYIFNYYTCIVLRIIYSSYLMIQETALKKNTHFFK